MWSLVFSAGCVPGEPADAPTPSEYAVYTATIEQLFLQDGWAGPPAADGGVRLRPTQVVILSPTIASTHDASAATVAQDIDLKEELMAALDALQQAWPSLEQSTASEFVRVNASRTQLAASAFPDSSYMVLEEVTVDDLFGPPGGWSGFYSQHPGAPGLIRVSRVGFSRDGTQALVHIENQRSSMMGGGDFVLLERGDGFWRVVARRNNWIS
jgi:hypothetical protein